MSGKKGGILSSVANATGTSDFFSGSARYLYDPVGAPARDQRIKRTKTQNEIKRQEALQAANEAEAEGLKQTQERSAGFREQRSRQRLIAAQRSGRASTILTSPLGSSGSPAQPSAGAKSLLGE